MPAPSSFSFPVSPEDDGRRLDAAVARRVPGCSRSRAARSIRAGEILLDDRIRKPGQTVSVGQRVHGRLVPIDSPRFLPETLPLTVLYEDPHLLAVDKPPGQVVHPAPGHAGGTLANALLGRCRGLDAVGAPGRPGIVHRLDKDTSGLLLVAKTEAVLEDLAGQFRRREVRKRYLVLVHGKPPQAAGRIDLPIGRHPTDRKRMSTVSRKGRAAATRWKVRRCWDGFSLLEVRILTGRTHQIRVHLAAAGFPVAGDGVYGKRRRPPAAGPRQMLHAWRIGFEHPVYSRRMLLESPLAADMRAVIDGLGAWERA